MELPDTLTRSMTRDEELEKTKRLYPNLDKLTPTAPNIYQEPSRPDGLVPSREPNRNSKGNNFRLHKINEVQKILEVERDKRANLAKKYQRCINVMSGFAYGFDFTAVGLGTTGQVLLTAVIATPIVIRVLQKNQPSPNINALTILCSFP